MALQVPLQAVASQTLTTNLAGQATQLNVYQKSTGLFVDVLLDNAPVVTGALCEDANRVIRDAYFGYDGDFMFVDIQGTSDPDYTGLGSRFQLFYLTAADLAAGAVSVG